MNKKKIEQLIFVSFTAFNISSPLIAEALISLPLYANKEISSSAKLISLLQKNKYYNLKNLYISSIFIDSNRNEDIANNIENEQELSIKEFKDEVNELFIESKIQSEKNNILNAKGNVVVKFKGNILNADNLIYDKLNKFAYATGNVLIKIKDQRFEAEKIEYDFINKKGNLYNVKGLINTENIISDFDFKFDTELIESTSIIPKIKKYQVLHTPSKVKYWILNTKKITIDQNIWSSKKAFFTNDLLESDQIKLEFNDLEVYSYSKKLKFKSKINYMILDKKVSIPFWFGERTIAKESEKGVSIQNKWNIGFDKLDKDGLYFGRKFNPIKISDDLFLNIEPQFLPQRSVKGHTNSFVQKDYSLNSERVKSDISLSDNFAFDSSIKGTLNDWNIKIEKELNSFDLDRYPNATRVRAEISKGINIFNNNFVSRFYAAYRDRIWNGSIGESEIYGAYGWQIDQKKSWQNKGIKKNQNFVLGFGNFKAEELNTNHLKRSIKGAIFYEFDQRIPLIVDNQENKIIDKSFKYIPMPIKKGIFLNTKFSTLYNLYEFGNSQQYIGFGLGPEINFGNYSRDYFDYTRISLMPVYKFKSGDSVFKFDQISEKLTISLDFDQHIIGPVLVETSGSINLDSDSKDYGHIINSKVSINWMQRSYKLGLFYKPHNESGGISFTLYGFE